MKEAVKFMKIDYSITKSQRKTFVLFLVLAVVLMFINDGMVSFTAAYLSFGAVTLATGPFGVENFRNMHFMCLLPASTKSRVKGRFLYALAYQLIAFAVSAFLGVVQCMRYSNRAGITDEFFQFILLFPVIMTGISLLIVGFEYTLLYAVGVRKSAQNMKVICMLPGLLMFALGSFAGEELAEAGASVSLPALAAISMVVGILSLFLFFEISVYILAHRDSI